MYKGKNSHLNILKGIENQREGIAFVWVILRKLCCTTFVGVYFAKLKEVHLGLSSSTGSSEAREMLETAMTSMMKLSNSFLVTNQ